MTFARLSLTLTFGFWLDDQHMIRTASADATRHTVMAGSSLKVTMALSVGVMLSVLFTGAGLAEDGSSSLSSAADATPADLTSAQERRQAPLGFAIYTPCGDPGY